MGQRCWLMLLVVIVLQYKRYQINTLEPETYAMLYVNYISIKLRKKLLKKLTWHVLLFRDYPQYFGNILLLFSRKVMSSFLPSHGLQHAKLPCALSIGVCSNSCPLSWWNLIFKTILWDRYCYWNPAVDEEYQVEIKCLQAGYRVRNQHLNPRQSTSWDHALNLYMLLVAVKMRVCGNQEALIPWERTVLAQQWVKGSLDWRIWSQELDLFPRIQVCSL